MSGVESDNEGSKYVKFFFVFVFWIRNKLIPVLNVLEADVDNLPNEIDEGYFDAAISNGKIIFHIVSEQSPKMYISRIVHACYFVQYIK